MCLTPFYRKDNPEQALPCGQCEHCRKRRASAWSFRLMRHSRTQPTSWFITLTYNTDHVPLTKNGYMSLNKRDVQLFMKRLRKLDDGKLSYYCAGEYGSENQRPHYHILMFGLLSSAYQVSDTDYRIDVVNQAWGKGEVHIGSVTDASVGYSLKYISKPRRIPMHNRDDRQRECSLMSKRLGAQYLTENMIRWHKDDLLERMYVPLDDGKKIAMPRYYKDKVYTSEERGLVAGWQQSKMIAEEQIKRMEIGDTEFDRLQYERKKHSAEKMKKNK